MSLQNAKVHAGMAMSNILEDIFIQKHISFYVDDLISSPYLLKSQCTEFMMMSALFVNVVCQTPKHIWCGSLLPKLKSKSDVMLERTILNGIGRRGKAKQTENHHS